MTELRLVVDPSHRRRRVGMALAREALRGAVAADARKIVVEAVAQQESTIAMFEALGFEAEALLRAHALDSLGQPRDLIVLAHHVQDNWEAMDAIGLTDALRQA